MKYVFTICQRMVGPRYCELCLNCPRASMCPTIVNYIMFVTSYSVTYCIYIPGKPGFCSHYCADYEECKYSDTFWLADRVRLFVHYTISLSSLWKLIWGHWTYEMPDRYILSSVWVRLSIFSQLSILQYMGLCVFSLPIPLVMIERIYTMSYYHNQIGSMNCYPLFRVSSWNNGMRCMSLYILIRMVIDVPSKCHVFSTSYLMVTQKQIPVRSWRIQPVRWLHENTSNELSLCLFQFGTK